MGPEDVRPNTSFHDRRLARRLKEDPNFREGFERSKREIAAIDAIVNRLKARLAEVERERDHWKANHDSQVKIKQKVQGFYRGERVLADELAATLRDKVHAEAREYGWTYDDCEPRSLELYRERRERDG